MSAPAVGLLPCRGGRYPRDYRATEAEVRLHLLHRFTGCWQDCEGCSQPAPHPHHAGAWGQEVGGERQEIGGLLLEIC